MHHRYYSPRLGHFLNPDFRPPDIYDPTTFSEPYAYAAGDPVIFWDPNGLEIRFGNLTEGERHEIISGLEPLLGFNISPDLVELNENFLKEWLRNSGLEVEEFEQMTLDQKIDKYLAFFDRLELKGSRSARELFFEALISDHVVTFYSRKGEKRKTVAHAQVRLGQTRSSLFIDFGDFKEQYTEDPASDKFRHFGEFFPSAFFDKALYLDQDLAQKVLESSGLNFYRPP